MVTGNRRRDPEGIAVFYLTRKARDLALRIVDPATGLFPNAACFRLSKDEVRHHWAKGGRLVFIMATGIVVRTIAPFLGDKRIDPAVVVLDEHGQHAISLLSGHLGGANALAQEVSRFLDAAPVITTASDLAGLPAVDLWAEEQGLVVEDWDRLPSIAGRLLDRGTLRLYSDTPIDAPEQFLMVEDAASADIVVTNRLSPSAGASGGRCFLRPRNVVVGVGCNSGTLEEEIEGAVKMVLDEAHISHLSLRALATIDIKGDEPGLRAFAENHGLPLLTFTPEELNGVDGVELSQAALKATGAKAVAEPAAVLASRGTLLVPKRKIGNVTIAIARDGAQSREGGQARTGVTGMLYVVGTGPGSADDLTPRALEAIRASEVVVGYGPYLDLIRPLTSGKEVVSTGMAQEIDRCRRAIELYRQGRTVSVISGGDPGIYAMAGLVLELLHKESDPGPQTQAIRIIPGISALNACAARLGAPLMHDFAVISLSDRLTPWETIEGRLEAAAKADFVIVLYNPRSKGRAGHIARAREIILRHRSAETPVGIVRGATREQEEAFIADLGSLPVERIDMQTTVIVGNSRSLVWNNLMITPRGYEKKKAW